MNSIVRAVKKRREKLGITYFGLQGHEVAVLKTTLASAPDLAAEYDVREPNHAGACGIVLVNKDSQVAKSWWKTYKKQHPSAVPLFLTDSKDDLEDGAFCKRPFSPSFIQAAVEGLVSETMA